MSERKDDAAAVRQRLLVVVGARPGPPAAPAPPGQAHGPSGASSPAESAALSEPVAPSERVALSGPVADAEPADASSPSGLPAAGRRLPVLGGSSPFDPGRRGVKALAVVAILVVLTAGFLAWRSRPRAEPVAADLPGSMAPAGSAAPVGPAAPAGPAQTVPAASGSAEIVVAIAGKVRRPGLVRLPPGSRVADAIEAAGGVLPGTDMATVNLARKVVDGELIVVGVPGPAAAAGDTSAGPAGMAGGKVNLNTATLAQLDTLPGVGQVLAQRILDYRTSHGGFRSVSDLRQVDGIGDSRFEQLKDLVTV